MADRPDFSARLARLALRGAVAAAICSAGLTFPAWAQDQTSSPAAASASATGADTTGQLQEVVVTAERRAEDVQSTPIAVTAVSGSQLQQQMVTRVNDLSTVAPALSVVNQGGYQLITMRGVGNTLGQDPITTGVPMILDGLNNPRGTGLSWPMFDIADVELLRGPQGTFVGSNSTGGAIEVTSANPNFRGVNGYATLQAGNYHDNLVEAAVNLPVSDTFAMRLAIHTEAENSFYSNQGIDREEIPYASQAMLDPGNQDERSVRVSALWKPTNSFQFLFKVQYDENNTDGLPYNVNPNTFSPLPGLACPYTTAPNGQCYGEYHAYYSGNPWVLNSGLPYQKYEYWDRMYIGEARYTFGNGDVLRLFGGSEGSQTPEVDPVCYCSASGGDGFALGGVGMAAEPNTNDNVELDLISPTQGRFQWILGASTVYSNGAFTSYSYTTGPAPVATAADPQIASIPAGETTREAGVFGHFTFQLTQTLQLEAGVRGNWDNNFGTGTFNIYPSGTYSCDGVPAATATCSTPIPTSFPPLAYSNNQGQYKSNHQTEKFGLNWQATPDEYLYAFYARGYAPGVTQYHAFGTLLPNAQAETLNDYEIGWKGTYLQHHVTTQLDGYYDQYFNMQQTIFNPLFPNNGGLANVPRANIDGIEANMQAQLGGFGANLAAAYTHSSLEELQDVATYKLPAGVGKGAGAYLPSCPAGDAPGTVIGGEPCFNYAPYTLNLGGEETPYAPRLTVNVTLQYGFVIGDATLQPRVQYSHMDKQYASLIQSDDYYEMGARNLWNAYLDFIDGAWRTSLYGTNLGDETYATNVTTNTILYGAPRQYGIQATRTF